MSNSVGGCSTLLFNRIINQLMRWGYEPFVWIILYVFRTYTFFMKIQVINKNHPKDGCIHLLPPVLHSELLLNLEFILALLVVPVYGTRHTVVGIYYHRHIEDSLQ